MSNDDWDRWDFPSPDGGGGCMKDLVGCLLGIVFAIGIIAALLGTF